MLPRVEGGVSGWMLCAAGIIQFVPITGILGATQLRKLYGLAFADLNLRVLMRHRALLMGVIGSFLLYATTREDVQPLALTTGFVCMTSFPLVAASEGRVNSALRKVVFADIVATVLLSIGAVARYFR